MDRDEKVSLAPTDFVRLREISVDLEHKMAQPKPQGLRRAATGFMPMSGQVLVRLCTKEEMSESGALYIPETAQEKPVEGLVLAVSRGWMDRNGVWLNSELEPGDHVLYGKYSGSTIVLRGEEMRLLSEKNGEVLGAVR